MNSTVIIGIDAGANGGIAIMCGGITPLAFSPKNSQEIDSALRTAKLYADNRNLPLVAFIEALTGYQANRPIPSQRAFTMGKFYGMAIGSLVSLGIEFRCVSPQEWQSKHPECKNSIYFTHKQLLKNKAKKLYPYMKITNKTADAVLIADYGKGVIANEA